VFARFGIHVEARKPVRQADSGLSKFRGKTAWSDGPSDSPQGGLRIGSGRPSCANRRPLARPEFDLKRPD